jgi:hypothetical protein
MFNSEFNRVGQVQLPEFSGTRVMMMPVIIGEPESVPIPAYKKAVAALFDMADRCHAGKVGYLTIDEKIVRAGETHRLQGLHVDGVYKGQWGGWGGGGGGWGSVSTGMLTVASLPGCRAWRGTFNGLPGLEGECEHLRDQLPDEGTLFGAGDVFWVSGLCVHESVPMAQETPRQFVRLSMPSGAPWFEGYTENPLGVKPRGPILPRRPQMDRN